MVKESFWLWKHLRGKPPAQVAQNDSQSMTVTNNNGQMIQVHADTLNLVLSVPGSTAAEKFVRDALDKEGVASLQITSEASAAPVADVSREEAPFFVPVAPESVVSDNLARMILTVISPVFQDGNKWRFNDGAGAFAAAILDTDFLSSVERGERFGKGDLLDVDVNAVQKRAGAKVSIERTVVKVYQHISPHEQLPFPTD